MKLILAPMEGLLDFTLRDILTRVGGVDRCVSEFIRITHTLLPERVFVRHVPELLHGGNTFAAVPGARSSWARSRPVTAKRVLFIARSARHRCCGVFRRSTRAPCRTIA